MARTLATFYVCGGVTGFLAAAGAEGSEVRRLLLVGMGSAAVGLGVVVARWGGRFDRPVFHAVVVLATMMISVATVVSPDPTTALLVSMIISFIAMDAFFFFPIVSGTVQLVIAVAGVTTGLTVRGDLAFEHIVGVNVIVLAIAVVTLSLAQWASRASRDELTGLRNRRGFDAALQELVAGSGRAGRVLTAVLLDLDNFKSINDTLGHDAGDLALRRLADQWGKALPSGSVLARHGGDEFSILLTGLRGPLALSLVQRVATDLPDPAVSCGVAEHHLGDSGAQLMRRADSALYSAKASGRGKCVLWAEPVSPINT